MTDAPNTTARTREGEAKAKSRHLRAMILSACDQIAYDRRCERYGGGCKEADCECLRDAESRVMRAEGIGDAL